MSTELEAIRARVRAAATQHVACWIAGWRELVEYLPSPDSEAFLLALLADRDAKLAAVRAVAERWLLVGDEYSDIQYEEAAREILDALTAVSHE